MTNLPLPGARDRARVRPEIRREEKVDRGLLTVFVLLLAVGLLVLYAASYYNAQDRDGSPWAEVISQLMGRYYRLFPEAGRKHEERKYDRMMKKKPGRNCSDHSSLTRH